MRQMTTFYGIKNFGEKLRKSDHKYLALEDLRSMLMQSMNVHSAKTLRHYMEILEQWGYLKRVVVDGAPRFLIQRWDGKNFSVDASAVVDTKVKDV
jgi:hypothetical protein